MSLFVTWKRGNSLNSLVLISPCMSLLSYLSWCHCLYWWENFPSSRHDIYSPIWNHFYGHLPRQLNMCLQTLFRAEISLHCTIYFWFKEAYIICTDNVTSKKLYSINRVIFFLLPKLLSLCHIFPLSTTLDLI